MRYIDERTSTERPTRISGTEVVLKTAGRDTTTHSRDGPDAIQNAFKPPVCVTQDGCRHGVSY
jgi:hypothetical protein